jgi:hypothetical protein
MKLKNLDKNDSTHSLIKEVRNKKMNKQFVSFKKSATKIVNKYFPKASLTNFNMLGVRSVRGDLKSRFKLSKSAYFYLTIPENSWPKEADTIGSSRKHFNKFKKELKEKFHVINNVDLSDSYGDRAVGCCVEIISKDYN